MNRLRTLLGEDGTVLLDGGMGTLLQEQGLDFVLGRFLALGRAGEELEEAAEPGGQRRVIHRDPLVGGGAVHGTGIE